MDGSKSIPKSAVRRLSPTLKSEKTANHQPPQEIKIKTPGKIKKPALTDTRASIQKKVKNKNPPLSIKSKTPSRKDKSKPAPTYYERIPKTRIKRKTPR